ncbi:MAG: DUF3526 domain-containing protein [Gammaproteobacteria bacterium]|nr:DUF3526 domain-containing protein [Gammaproteobacteria bacterium]
MKQVGIIAAQELRYWRRSHLIVVCTVFYLLLLLATSVITALKVSDQRHSRMHQQVDAEETFLSQPARHPHRMVHYGHYVFRTPPPMAVLDPGLEPVTGQSIFLEGHRQNTAVFSDSASSADLSSLSSLTPAIVYQLFAPLLIILIGHGAFVREREATTLLPLLAQGVKGSQLFAGKTLALMLVIGLLLSPLILVAPVTIAAGESILTVLVWVGVYLIYFYIWGTITLCASLYFRRRSSVLTVLISLWLVVTLAIPALALSLITSAEPATGKIETDLEMLSDLRALGDGHNANDPAFAALRAGLMREHSVDNIVDLPVNVRGIIALHAEKKLTDMLNAYAAEQMATEKNQADHLQVFGWLSPTLALSVASRAIAGTDLNHHHRFLREAEQLRFDFVQGLNRVHAEQLAYSDDIKRSSDTEAERRTRVSADNWEVLDLFHFDTAPFDERLGTALPSLSMLALWLGVLSAMVITVVVKIKP